MKRLKYIFLLMACAFVANAQMNTDRLTAIGRNALYFDDYVLSIQYFNQVIKLKPYLAEPYLYRAIAKIQLGDYTGAEKDCTNAIKNSPFLPGAYYTRGFVYRQMGQYEKAEKDFTEALVFSPENKTYMILRSDVRAQQENYEGALEDINYLLRREPESPSLYFEKGVISMARLDTIEALNCFTRTTELDGQNAANWSARGLVNSMLGNNNDAILDLTKAIDLGSKWPGDYINRGILFYKNHNYRGALADYDKAIEMDPQNDQCYYNRGLLRQELGDYNNAISDYNKALDIDPDNIEVHYQRGVTNLQLKQWKAALADFEVMIDKYPYFLPSYYLAAQAKKALGDSKGEYLYQEKAAELEKNKDKIRAQQVNTNTQLADAQPQKKDRRKEFSNRAAQNQTDSSDDEKYTTTSRGAVQNKYADVVNQPNIILTYYAQQESLRRTSYFHFQVDEYNRLGKTSSQLKFTIQEIALTADMVNIHFEQIGRLSNIINQLPETIEEQEKVSVAEIYFARSFEFALVQDYISAIDDCNRAIYLLPSSPKQMTSKEQGLWAIAYFCRANWRYKQLDYKRASGDDINAEEVKLEFEMLLRDYDRVILEQPDFSFAYYNKANMLCLQRDFKAAISYYDSAISVDADFAEAYFNRGLTYIYIGENEKGLADLSKAGELGIYQAYNLISRFK